MDDQNYVASILTDLIIDNSPIEAGGDDVILFPGVNKVEIDPLELNKVRVFTDDGKSFLITVEEEGYNERC